MIRRHDQPLPRQRETRERIDRRVGDLLGALEETLGEVARGIEGDEPDVRERSGEGAHGGLRASWSVRVGTAASPERRRPRPTARASALAPDLPHELSEAEEGWIPKAEMPGAERGTLEITARGDLPEIAASRLRRRALSVELAADGRRCEGRLPAGVVEVSIARRAGGGAAAS